MKRWLAVLCLFVVIAAIPIACHKKSGGEEAAVTTPGGIPEGPGPNPATPPITFATPQQAATSTSAIEGTQALSNAQFAAVMALGLSSKPEGFAPGLSKGSGAIANVDPTLAMMVTELQRLAASPTVQKAVRKAGALKTAAALSSMLATSVSTTLTTEFCSNADGTVSIEGQNNYDEAANPSVTSAYKIVFTNCLDDILFTRLTGALTIDDAASTDNVENKASLLAENLMMEQFSTAAMDVKTQQSVLNGAFIKDDKGLSGSNAGGGTFMVTIPAGVDVEKVVTYTYDGLIVGHTHTDNPDATDTVVTTTKGSFKVTSTSGGVKTFELNLAIDLTDERIQLNDAAGTENSKLSGAIDITYAPEMAASGCQSGKVTISTVSTAPRVFTNAGGACPQKGTVNINNASINYDPGQPIQVSIGSGAPQNFADCAALAAAGGSCKF